MKTRSGFDGQYPAAGGGTGVPPVIHAQDARATLL